MDQTDIPLSCGFLRPLPWVIAPDCDGFLLRRGRPWGWWRDDLVARPLEGVGDVMRGLPRWGGVGWSDGSVFDLPEGRLLPPVNWAEGTLGWGYAGGSVWTLNPEAGHMQHWKPGLSQWEIWGQRLTLGAEQWDWPTGLEYPRHIWTDEARNLLWVADTGNRRVLAYAFTEGRETVRRFPVPVHPVAFLGWARGCLGILSAEGSLGWVHPEAGWLGGTDPEREEGHPFLDTGRLAGGGLRVIDEGGRIWAWLPPSREDWYALARKKEQWAACLHLALRDGDEAGAVRMCQDDPRLLALWGRNAGALPPPRELLEREWRDARDALRTEWPEIRNALDHLGISLVKLYKSIPLDGEREVSEISKEKLRFRLNTTLVHARELWERLAHAGGLGGWGWPVTPDERGLWQALTTSSLSGGIAPEEDEKAVVSELVRTWLLEDIRPRITSVLEESLPDLPQPWSTLAQDNLCNLLDRFWGVLGLLAFHRGEVHVYRELMLREVRLYPEREQTFLDLLHGLYRLGAYRDVVDLQERHPTHDRKGLNELMFRVWLRLGDAGKAAAHLLRELELFPHRVELLADLLIVVPPDDPRLEELLRRLKDLPPLAGTRRNLARIHWVRGEWTRARALLEEELALFPEEVKTWRDWVDLCLADPATLSEERKNLLNICPGRPHDLRARVITLWWLWGERGEARRLYDAPWRDLSEREEYLYRLPLVQLLAKG